MSDEAERFWSVLRLVAFAGSCVAYWMAGLMVCLVLAGLLGFFGCVDSVRVRWSLRKAKGL